jgi:hypothetical protein
MIKKLQTLEVRGRKSSKPWKFFAVLFPMLGSLAFAQGPGSQVGFFQAWWGAASAVDPYETLLPTAYWYPSRDLNNTDRILGIASTNTVNAASVSANGWEFNGTSQFLNFGKPSAIEIGTNIKYSIVYWMNAATLTGFRVPVGKITFTGGGDRWGFYLENATLYAFLEEGNISRQIGTSLQTGIWYQAAFTLNRQNTNDFRLYLDGVQVGVTNFTDIDPITFAATPPFDWYFGAINTGPGTFYHGYLDRAAVWNGRALTSNEVFTLFQQTRSGRK